MLPHVSQGPPLPDRTGFMGGLLGREELPTHHGVSSDTICGTRTTGDYISNECLVASMRTAPWLIELNAWSPVGETGKDW